MYTPNFTPNRPFPLKPLAAAVLLVCASGIHSAPILDAPNNDITVDLPVGQSTTVTQHVERAVVNWQEFSIAEGEVVKFMQPNANSVILNRVVGGDPSQILGALQANGRVFLINPNGIVFGEKSVVSVGGLVASTLSLKPGFQGNDDVLEFQSETSSGGIESLGTINAKDIVFLAPVINNTGSLNASVTGAAVNLIAASEVTANIGGADMVFTVKAGHENALIDQLGSVLAQGGKIVLLASSTNNGAGSVINTAGVNEASHITVQGDTVQLTGTFTASNPENALQVSAKTIRQLAALTVVGSSQLIANEVKLDNEGNDFKAQVNVNSSGHTGLRDVNTLTVAGTSATASLNAADVAVNGLTTTGNLKVDATNAAALNNLNAGSLTANATTIDQTETGTVEVQNIATLTANTVTLGNTGNDFKGQVNVNSSGHTGLRDVNKLTLNNLNAGSLTVNATTIDQTETGTVEVQNTATLTANTVTLGNTGNDFKGQVNVNSSGHTDLRDANKLTLNNLNAGSLTVNATTIDQTETGTVEVQNTATLTANTVTLGNTGNDFKGQVNVNSSGHTGLRDVNTLTVAGASATASLNAADVAVNGLTTTGNLKVDATNAAALNNLNAGSLTVNATSIDQTETGTVEVQNTATLTANTVTLGNASNDFKGQVNVNSSGHTDLRDANKLTLNNLNAGSLTVNATTIDQTETGTVEVQNTATLTANTVTLGNASNDFKGQVNVNSSGHTDLRDVNTLTVAGTSATASLNAAGVAVNGLTTTGNLKVDATNAAALNNLNAGSLTVNAATIDQTETGTVEVQNTATLTANTVTLGNTGNDFKGQVNVNSSGHTDLRDVNTLTVAGASATASLNAADVAVNGLTTTGNLKVDATNAAALNNLNAGSLTVNATTIDQTETGTVEVQNTATLTTNTVTLGNTGNDFKGQVNVNSSGHTDLRDANKLTLNNLNAGSLTVNATTIDQTETGTVEVQNTATLTANTVTLGNTGNDFKGQVNVNSSGHTDLRDANKLTLNNLNAGSLTVNATTIDQTETGTVEVQNIATLTANTVTLGNTGNDFKGQVNVNSSGHTDLRDANKLTLNNLNAGSLTVNATTIDQTETGTVEVQNTATLTANTVTLGNTGNDFKGQVNFEVTDQVMLHDSNNLIVAGNVKSATIDAQTLTVNGLSAAGNVTLKANSISDGQDGAVVVAGTSTLQGGSVNLDNSGNRFDKVVDLNLSGASTVYSSENLEVAGKAASVSASSGQSLTVSNLTSQTIVLDGKQVQLNGFSTTGNLTLTGGDVTQQGALTVGGVTTLAAAKVTLEDAGNDFKNTVILNSAGDVKIQDANSVVLQGTVNKLTATAIADVNQAAALTVTKASDITAANINLNNEKNVFGDVVTVNATQVAAVHSDQNLAVGGSAGTLNAVAGENLRLSSATVGTLNATGKKINQTKPTDNVQVTGNATLTAQNVNLQNASNDFKGVLELVVTGQADVVDGNDLFLKGHAQTLNATASGTLTAGDLEMSNGTLAASTIQMNKLNVLEKAQLQATTVTQTEANQSGGEITIAADTVSLALENDFKGNVILNNVGAATIHDNNQLVLSGSAKNLTVKAAHIKQSDALKVEGLTNLVAGSIELMNDNNDFEGVVDLQVVGKVLLRDANSFTVQGNAGEVIVQAKNTVTLGDLQAGSLNATANVLEQSAAVDVAGNVVLNTNTANLIEKGNAFGGAVLLNGGNNTLHTTGDLKVEGRSAQLNVKARNVTQSNTLTVTGPAALSADTVELLDEKNDFQANVNTTVAGNVAIHDQNDLSISGSMQQLDVSAGKALELKNLTAELVKAQADQIELDGIASSKSTHLKSRSVTQGESLSFNGETTIQATSVKLENRNNDFGDVLNLSATEFAEITDANALMLGDVRGGGVLKLTAQSVNQGETSNPGPSINYSGDVSVTAANVQLNRIDNDFSGRLTVNSDNATVVDSNSLNINFVGRDLSATANKLVIENIQASGNLVLTAEAADVSSQHDLSIQGNVGDLTVRANRLTQAQALTVRNIASLQATTVELFNDANDFQGEVALNVAGSTKLNDANALVVSGNVNDPSLLKAQSIQQVNALSAKSGLTLQANKIALDNNANKLNGVVRIEGQAQANTTTLHSQGALAVEGANISHLKLVAKEAVLGDLGELQQLEVTSEKLTQSAALHVQRQTVLNADNVTLEDSKNDFVGEVILAGKDSSVPEVSIADKNSLNVQATDVKLAAQVQGNFGLKAQNVVLNATTVAGGSNINLTGALTQNELVSLNNSVFKADSIALKDMGNRFNGTTQLDSGKTIQMSTSGDLNADNGSSTGALSLTVGGNTTVKGAQVVFAQSQLDGNLEVNANGISQTNSLHVGGTTELNAVGGTVSLQHVNNQFQNTVNATAEQTDINARGDLQVMNLMSRGGQITADGRLLFLGNVEQTGGTLTFTAKGAPSALSSAEIAILLPPALDVFSAKEAVDPITGLGRITLASPAIDQQSGQILTAAGSMTQFNSTANGSVVLTKNNQINGQLAALSGQNYGQAYGYNPAQGASLFAVNNDVQLRVAGMGVEADLVAIRARGVSTAGDVSQIRARMPYNDIAAGTSRSFAGLTLSIPTGNVSGSQGGVALFGESSGVGQSAVSGAIRVEVGEVNRAGFGGFVTVLPFEGNNLLPGQVVYLAGPERKGKYVFFYDGARSLSRVPVVYNGSLLVSPQESAALTTAQGAVVLARQEQTRSVVRTENVAGKIINGVVLEVGPGRPATEGIGGAGKPASCDAAEEGLSCNP